MFLDRSGLRRRRMAVIGAAIATTLITGLVILVVGFLGTPAGPVPGFPGADGVHRSSAPSAAAEPKPSAVTAPPTTAAAQPSTTASPLSTPSPSTRRHYPSHPPKPSRSR